MSFSGLALTSSFLQILVHKAYTPQSGCVLNRSIDDCHCLAITCSLNCTVGSTKYDIDKCPGYLSTLLMLYNFTCRYNTWGSQNATQRKGEQEVEEKKKWYIIETNLFYEERKLNIRSDGKVREEKRQVKQPR